MMKRHKRVSLLIILSWIQIDSCGCDCFTQHSQTSVKTFSVCTCIHGIPSSEALQHCYSLAATTLPHYCWLGKFIHSFSKLIFYYPPLIQVTGAMVSADRPRHSSPIAASSNFSGMIPRCSQARREMVSSHHPEEQQFYSEHLLALQGLITNRTMTTQRLNGPLLGPLLQLAILLLDQHPPPTLRAIYLVSF